MHLAESLHGSRSFWLVWHLLKFLLEMVVSPQTRRPASCPDPHDRDVTAQHELHRGLGVRRRNSGASDDGCRKQASIRRDNSSHALSLTLCVYLAQLKRFSQLRQKTTHKV